MDVFQRRSDSSALGFNSCPSTNQWASESGAFGEGNGASDAGLRAEERRNDVLVQSFGQQIGLHVAGERACEVMPNQGKERGGLHHATTEDETFR